MFFTTIRAITKDNGCRNCLLPIGGCIYNKIGLKIENLHLPKGNHVGNQLNYGEIEV